MMTEKLYIESQGETFVVSLRDGAISRPARGVVGDARRWRMVGVSQAGNGRQSTFIPLGIFAEMVRNGLFANHYRNGEPRTETHFANGAPRLSIRDFDHGTYRQCGAGITNARLA